MGKRDIKDILEKHPGYADQIKERPQWIKGKDNATLIVACQKLTSNKSDSVILFAKRCKYSSIGIITKCDENAQIPFTNFPHADLQELEVTCVAFIEANRALLQIHVYFKSSAEKTWILQFASLHAMQLWIVEMRKYLGLNKGESSIKGVCVDLETYLFREIDPFSSDVLLSIENVREEEKHEDFLSRLEGEIAEQALLEREIDSENSDISLDDAEEEEKLSFLQETNIRLKEEMSELKLQNKALLRELQLKQNEEHSFRNRMERNEDRSYLIPTKEKTNRILQKNTELIQQVEELKKINLLLINENDALKKQMKELKDVKREQIVMSSKKDESLSMELAKKEKMYNDLLNEKNKIEKRNKAVIDMMTQQRKSILNRHSQILNEKNLTVKDMEQKLASLTKLQQETSAQLLQKQKECNEMKAIFEEKQRRKEKKSKQKMIQKQKQYPNNDLKMKQQVKQAEIKVAKVEMPPNPQPQELPQPVKLQLEKKNKDALRLIAEREQKISELQLDRLLHIFEKDALSGEREAKMYLCQQISQLCKRKIRFTKLLCNLDPLNKTNFHKYIDEVPNICMVVRTVANELIAGFSIHPISQKNPAIQGGILANMSRKKAYFCKEGRKAVTHDDVYMIFGNSELRVLSGGDDLLSNLGISKGFFDNRGDKVTDLIGDCPDRTVKLICYEFHQVVFY